MKQSTLFLLLGLCVSTSGWAKIWRVNNNQSISADFTTLIAAHNGASGGDTLHIEPSATSYGGLTITKKLVIIGPGYYLGDNPNTQANKQVAQVDAFNLQVGAAGSTIMGLDFFQSSISVFANDIVIRRNKFTQPSGNVFDNSTGIIYTYWLSNNGNIPVQNIIITQNFGCQININNASNGILISNNYIAWNGWGGNATAGACLSVNANAIVIVQNNIFRRGAVSVNNSSIINNIMVAGTFSGTGNLVSNNLGNGTQFGSDNGNVSNVTIANIFVGAGTGISFDGQWKLATNSPAIGAGFGSTVPNPVDGGMFSGQSPYVLSGIPPIPAVYAFENKPIGSNSDPITVTIKVKSNN